MTPVSNIAGSALTAFGQRLTARAHNIANQQTEGFEAVRVTLSEQARGGVVADAPTRPGNGVDLATEMVGSMTDARAYQANAAVIRSEDELLGTLLDIVG